ncbi:MAG: ankyrin repeat domain-containing protein [Candidatus Babeliales bacterium]|jgi:ankyrin repeat protein
MNTKIVLLFLPLIMTFSNASTIQTPIVKPFQNFHICEQVTPLMHACQDGKVDEVKRLVREGALVNAMDYWEFLRGGTSVLGYAFRRDISSDILNELLQAGANPNSFINDGIHLEPDLHVRIIPVLTYAISRRVPIQYPHQKTSFGAVEQLIYAGADVNAPDPIFNIVTPLIMAAGLGQVETVKYLLQVKADKRFKNRFNKTALDYAREHLHRVQEIIALLEK